MTIRSGRIDTIEHHKLDTDHSPLRLDNLLPNNRNYKAKHLEANIWEHEIDQMETNLKRLLPPGLQDIKQVNLHAQWGLLMPTDEE
eukprot:11542408-Ditylum_brightwellii.AAC.1